MPNYRRAWLAGGIFFFTVVTYRRYPIFAAETATDLLMQCLQTTIAEHPFTLDALVILPDHLHCIWTLPEDDPDFATRWKRIKASFTRSYSGNKAQDISESMQKKKEKGIWQRMFWEHWVRDQNEFNRYCDYIHYNPVRHGLVSLPIEWKHSSFRSFVGKGLYTADWGQAVSEELLQMNLE